MDSYAIIVTGGKQEKVAVGRTVRVETLSQGVVGEQTTFDKVLMVADKGQVKVGQPYVQGATVVGTIVEEGRAKKITIIKMKRRKGYRRKQGHRQNFMLVRIDAIA